MDKLLFDLVSDQVPKFNEDLAEGWAVREMRLVEQQVHRNFKTAAADFPPELQYIGYERTTPQEEFAQITKKQNSQASHDLARSDVYLVKYYFTFNGEELDPVLLYLPFVSEAGTIYIRGSEFAIAPVLADKAMSVGPSSIFIPLNRDRLTFESVPHNFYANDQPKSPFVVYSQIYHLKPAARAQLNKSWVRGRTTLAHYLFAKYGIYRTFKMFADASIVIGSEREMTRDRFPADKWVLCRSTGLKPRGVRDRMYVATDLILAIPVDRFNLTTENLIGGFFYIVDHFPQRVDASYIGQDGEERLWKTLMGLLLFGMGVNEGKLVDDIDAHLRSLDTYVDSEAKVSLRDGGIECEDLYQLLMYIIESFNSRVTNSTAHVASMYDKRLMVRRYVLMDLTNAINKFMFKVTSFKPRMRPLTKADVTQMIRLTLKIATITGIRHGHREISSVAVPGDNKIFKVTSRVVPQVDSSGAKAKTKATVSDPSKLLHCSIAEVGSFSTMAKSEPTGRDKINPYVHVDQDGLILRDPSKTELLDSVQRQIQRTR